MAHVAGGFELDGYWLDAHSGAMPDAMVALAAEIIPHLPNLKAIVFEMFTSFLPRFGLDAIRGEMDRVRGLWELRRPGAAYATRTPAVQIEPMKERVARIEVAEWESALGGLAIGQTPQGAAAMELRADAGVKLMQELIQEFRASMVVGVYRLISQAYDAGAYAGCVLARCWRISGSIIRRGSMRPGRRSRSWIICAGRTFSGHSWRR